MRFRSNRPKGVGVFDRARGAHNSGAPGSMTIRDGFTGFHRDDIDRTPARGTVTGLLLGDPAPGKFEHRPLWDPETGQMAIDRRVSLPRLRLGSREGDVL